MERSDQEKGLWLEKVYYEHYKRLLFHAYKLTDDWAEGEDIVAQAFMKLLGSPDSIESREHCVRSLYTIVKHKCIDHLRSKGRQKGLLEKYVQSIDQEVVQTFVEMDHRLRIIQQLSPDLQEVLQLHYVQGYSHKEIAVLLNISADNAKKRCSRAVNKLRALVPEQASSFLPTSLNQ
jgi:RNA polymerase sigma-70 factor (ECF subfamily)